MILKHVTTDHGRGRAWLRSALNEHSLERFMEQLTNDPKMASTYYDPGAFLLDYERSTMLPQIASGVGTILFALNIDNSDLDNLLEEAEAVTEELVADEDVNTSVNSTGNETWFDHIFSTLSLDKYSTCPILSSLSSQDYFIVQI